MVPRLSCLILVVFFAVAATGTMAQEPDCRGALYGTIGFSDLKTPPLFRTLPGATMVLSNASTRTRVLADDDGDIESPELRCGRYRVDSVIAPDGTPLKLAQGQARIVHVADGGVFFDLVVELGASASASWSRDGELSRLDATCSQADSPLRLELQQTPRGMRRPLRQREIALVATNVSSDTLRLNRRGFWPARIFDRYGLEVGYIPDYPFGPPAPPTEDDVLTLAPGEKYVKRFELGESTEEEIERFKKAPYYLQAHYYGSPFESQANIRFDQISACSPLLIVR